MRHLVDGLVVDAADAGVARDSLVVQHVAAVSGESADDCHYEGHKHSVVVAGPARICFGFVVVLFTV